MNIAKENLKTMGYAHTQTTITQLTRDLRRGGYQVTYNRTQGTMIATDDHDQVVARAIKHPGGWLLRANPTVVTPRYT